MSQYGGKNARVTFGVEPLAMDVKVSDELLDDAFLSPDVHVLGTWIDPAFVEVQTVPLTREEWLTSRDPLRLLNALLGHGGHALTDEATGAFVVSQDARPGRGPSPRKLRLFALHVSRLLTPPPQRTRPDWLAACARVERMADGLKVRRRDCERSRLWLDQWDAEEAAVDGARNAIAPLLDPMTRDADAQVADLLREICYDPFGRVCYCEACQGSGVDHATRSTALSYAVASGANAQDVARFREELEAGHFVGQALILPRGVTASPLLVPRLPCPECKGAGHLLPAHWLTQEVSDVAQAIYADSRFDELPVLADALEDAGCDQGELLGHLRGAGPHVRGCWALDLVLGKGRERCRTT